MSIVGQTVRSVENDLVADLRGGNIAPGTDIIVFPPPPADVPPQAGFQNQRWRFIPVDAAQNVYTIQNVWTNAYASVDILGIAAGAVVNSNPIPFNWHVVPVDMLNANRTIRVPNTNFVWNAGAAIGNNITIQLATGNPDQQWVIGDV